MAENIMSTTCCIVGGGPAGMMLGWLLARAGINVVVLEKHADFNRDFRGDTIHPSTFQIMDELRLLQEFLKVPHQEIGKFKAVFNNVELQLADFTQTHSSKSVMGLMPQWDFLKFVQQHAAKYPSFKLVVNARVTDLVWTDKRVTGVKVETDKGPLQVNAKLIAGADGRHSVIREKARLKVIKAGVPIDVLWFRVPRRESDPGQILGRFAQGKIMVMLDRDDYWQCAYLIAKNGFETIQQNGIEKFRDDVVTLAPFLADRKNEIKNWDDIKLLSVDIDHLDKWYTDGLLCIGDSAHAMSPVGGVGINLAIQDAVAAANILYQPLKQQTIIGRDVLSAVQKRRAFPARVIQQLQIFIQNRVFKKRMSEKDDLKPPLFFFFFNWFPFFQRFPARLLGMGVRVEHIKTPQI